MHPRALAMPAVRGGAAGRAPGMRVPGAVAAAVGRGHPACWRGLYLVYNSPCAIRQNPCAGTAGVPSLPYAFQLEGLRWLGTDVAT